MRLVGAHTHYFHGMTTTAERHTRHSEGEHRQLTKHLLNARPYRRTHLQQQRTRGVMQKKRRPSCLHTDARVPPIALLPKTHNELGVSRQAYKVTTNNNLPNALC